MFREQLVFKSRKIIKKHMEHNTINHLSTIFKKSEAIAASWFKKILVPSHSKVRIKIMLKASM